ncbi:MAG: prepilin-type N-terminal cleavage/methylation domain-containing protein [Elusimicrobiaceae bacterium]|nr:prepilin-type N-terminal cleavage/methylation domain-containing protein [Elusimicrobiaceae bacterium]
MKHNKQAFTLIELLVVVLIIGLLSAIALPQYEKAIWKSKAANLQLLTRRIGEEHQIYYDDNATCATSFAAIDTSLDGALPTELNNSTIVFWDGYGRINGRGNDNFSVGIYCDQYRGYWILGRFSKGPYAGSGFAFLNDPVYTGIDKKYSKQLLCLAHNDSDGINKGFCKMFSNTEPIKSSAYDKFYEM